MSLTTVVATTSATEPRVELPPAQPERFQRSDFIAAAIVALVTLGVYAATLAPNVTLEDSGELITGATKFGVPHPPATRSGRCRASSSRTSSPSGIWPGAPIYSPRFLAARRTVC